MAKVTFVYFEMSGSYHKKIQNSPSLTTYTYIEQSLFLVSRERREYGEFLF
jgi:hypothetical protein